MANPEHVGIVRRGKEAIAAWRKRQPKEKLDLSGANLSQADLLGANLTRADLTKADLVEAILAGANLSGAMLYEVNLAGADLSGASLSRTNLAGADFTGADLSEASLFEAQLDGVHFVFCNLSDANLSRTWLAVASFLSAELSRTNLQQARLEGTRFADCDLSRSIGLETIQHDGPSTIGTDTLIATFRGSGGKFTKEQLIFFQKAGVPRELLKALPKIVREIKYYSCFIAYGAPDEEFAKKLNGDLEAKGVPCWFFKEEARVGGSVGSEVTKGLTTTEKTIVVCSAAGLGRDGLLEEIEKTVEDDPNRLVPVSRDNEWRRTACKVERGGKNLKDYLTRKVYADFAAKLYEKALEDLLRGLERPQARRKRRASTP